VARDFISVVANAHFRTVRERGHVIGIHAVERAAESIFETHKAPDLAPELVLRLRALVSTVVDGAGGRQFLLAPDQDDQAIQALHDLRVLHVVERGWRERGTGHAQDVYAIDCGACLALASDVRTARAVCWSDHLPTRVEVLPYA
jgi:hypothetical protein